MWRVLTLMGLVKPKMSSPLHLFASEQLAKYYSSITTTSTPCSTVDLAEAINDIATDNPFFTHVPFAMMEIYETIVNTVSSSYTPGSDLLSPFIIQKLAHILSALLTVIYNSSL
ncbi:hypothetical protein PV325_003630 [Microctonus aethiopoides]|nr:hypothetical protein PV325_003630 [Microctonus aethiopoides]